MYDIANKTHWEMKDKAKGLEMYFEDNDNEVKWVEVPNGGRGSKDYKEGMGDLLGDDDKCKPEIEFALVIISDKNIKKDIKRWADSKGIVT